MQHITTITIVKLITTILYVFIDLFAQALLNEAFCSSGYKYSFIMEVTSELDRMLMEAVVA
jgi:hypothetical protein